MRRPDQAERAAARKEAREREDARREEREAREEQELARTADLRGLLADDLSDPDVRLILADKLNDEHREEEEILCRNLDEPIRVWAGRIIPRNSTWIELGRSGMEDGDTGFYEEHIWRVYGPWDIDEEEDPDVHAWASSPTHVIEGNEIRETYYKAWPAKTEAHEQLYRAEVRAAVGTGLPVVIRYSDHTQEVVPVP